MFPGTGFRPGRQGGIRQAANGRRNADNVFGERPQQAVIVR